MYEVETLAAEKTENSDVTTNSEVSYDSDVSDMSDCSSGGWSTTDTEIQIESDPHMISSK